MALSALVNFCAAIVVWNLLVASKEMRMHQSTDSSYNVHRVLKVG